MDKHIPLLCAQWFRDERSGSGVELRTLDYENPGSNPGCGVNTLGKFFTLHCSGSLS